MKIEFDPSHLSKAELEQLCKQQMTILETMTKEVLAWKDKRTNWTIFYLVLALLMLIIGFCGGYTVGNVISLFLR